MTRIRFMQVAPYFARWSCSSPKWPWPMQVLYRNDSIIDRYPCYRTVTLTVVVGGRTTPKQPGASQGQSVLSAEAGNAERWQTWSRLGVRSYFSLIFVTARTRPRRMLLRILLAMTGPARDGATVCGPCVLGTLNSRRSIQPGRQFRGAGNP